MKHHLVVSLGRRFFFLHGDDLCGGQRGHEVNHGQVDDIGIEYLGKGVKLSSAGGVRGTEGKSVVGRT